MQEPTRREFLAAAAAFAASPVLVVAHDAEATETPGAQGREGSTSTTGRFSVQVRQFTEAWVAASCPADDRTPDGAACGLADAVERLLSGGYGEHRSAFPGLDRAELYRVGAEAIDRASIGRYGVPFAQLEETSAVAFLAEVRGGAVSGPVPLDVWSWQFVDPLLARASFEPAVYNRFGSRLFYRMFEGASPRG